MPLRNASNYSLFSLLVLITTSPCLVYAQSVVNETEAQIANENLQQSLPRNQQTDSAIDEQVDAAVDTLSDEPPAAGRTQELLVRGQQETQPAIKLKDVPLSVSVVTGVELEKFNTLDFRNIITRIGNVRATYTNPQAGSLILRGVGWASGAGPLDPSVGVRVDGVSYGISALASSLNYVDIESVDVTRGPQGTLGGKNTSLGEISIKTRAPSFTPDAYASITYGDLNTINTTVAVGGPVIDDLLAWRGTFLRSQADGPWKNLDDKNWSYKNEDRTFGRVQFLLTPTEDFSALLNLEYAPTSKEFSDNYVNFARPTPAYYDYNGADGKPMPVNIGNQPEGRLARRWFAQEQNYGPDDYLDDKINRLSQNPNNYASKGAALTLDWNVANHTLTSITAFRDFYFDSGGGPISVFDIERSPSTGHVEYEQLSQEFRISSNLDGLVNYQAGLFYFHNEIPERWTTARFGSDAGAYHATTAQYNRLDTDGNARILLQNSLSRLFTKTKDDIDNTSSAIYANADWNFTEAFTLTTGLRMTHEERTTRSSRFIVDSGYAPELNPVAINNVQLRSPADQLANDNFIAQKYFGVATFAALNSAQKQQVADARQIRLARIGGLYKEMDAEPFDEWLPTAVISPSYKLNDNQTAYFSWQHGEKAGISQIVGATADGGKSAPVKSERSDTLELGLKSVVLDNDLVINSGLYIHRVKNYIQPMFFYDEAQTIFNKDGLLAYTSGLGNVPEVESKGVELDVVYTGLPNTSLRFAGAYTDAVYKEFEFLAKPLELGGSGDPYYDATGKTLPGSAKFTFNIAAEYLLPLSNDKEFHSNINYRYSSKYNNDVSLSRYSVVDAAGILDIAVGIGRSDGLFDVNLIVKNVLDTDYGFYGNWNTYFPSTPRWVGIALSTNF